MHFEFPHYNEFMHVSTFAFLNMLHVTHDVNKAKWIFL